MTITEGAPVSALESTGLTNLVRIGGPTGMTNGCWVLIAASHNRAGGSSQTTLTLSGPGTEDAIVGGAINIVAGAHYCAAWLVYVDDVVNVPAPGETDPAEMWTVTSTTTATGIESMGDLAVAAFVLNGVMPTSPIDSSTPAAQATTITPTWDLANTTVADSTVYVVGCSERDLNWVPNSPITELVDIKTANATVGRRTTLFVGKVHMPSAGDPGAVTASLGATARQWRTFAFGLIPEGLVPNAGEDDTVDPGTRVFNNGTGSVFATTYLWEHIDTSGVPDLIIKNADEAISEFVAENETSSPITYTLRLTVGDGSDTATDTRVVIVNPKPEAPESLDIRYNTGTGFV